MSLLAELSPLSDTIAIKITLLTELCVSASPTRSRGVQFAQSPIPHHPITPTLQHSNTPTLQHSNTPTLHHSITPTLQHSNTPSLHHSITPSLRSAGFEHQGHEAPKPDFGFIDCATARIGTRWRYEAFPRFGDRCGFGERACGHGL